MIQKRAVLVNFLNLFVHFCLPKNGGFEIFKNYCFLAILLQKCGETILAIHVLKGESLASFDRTRTRAHEYLLYLGHRVSQFLHLPGLKGNGLLSYFLVQHLRSPCCVDPVEACVRKVLVRQRVEGHVWVQWLILLHALPQFVAAVVLVSSS